MQELGRKRIFEDEIEMQNAINDYFINGVREKKIVVGKGAAAKVVIVPVPTISGLCYHIGFESRQSFYDYEKYPAFSYTVKRARLFIEREYEEQLQGGNPTGAIFALKNMGWKDKVETGFTDNEGNDVSPVHFYIPDNGRSQRDKAAGGLSGTCAE